MLILGFFSSCIFSKKFGSIPIEVREPAAFTLPSTIKTATLINRDSFVPDSILAINYTHENWIKTDTAANKKLTNVCVSALARVLKSENRVDTVSLVNGEKAYSIHSMNHGQMNEFFKQNSSDLKIFIDSLYFKEIRDEYQQNLFRHKICLNWSLAYKNNDSLLVTHQKDSIEYFDFLVTYYKSTYILPYGCLYRSCIDIGSLLGKKLMPNWITVQRMFYRSNNPDMKAAEQFLLQNDFVQAAEIWNKKTQSKNTRLAGKAIYNIALACEMEGKFSIATDWLNKYISAEKPANKKYNAIFQQYINLLEQRKKDVGLLNIQTGAMNKY
jgi:hypothetical protein